MSSRARKHVQQDLQDIVELGDGDQIVLLLERLGGNLLRVRLRPESGKPEERSNEDDTVIVMIPSRFVGMVMIKRGTLLIVNIEPNHEKLSTQVVGVLVAPLVAPEQLEHLYDEIPEGWRAAAFLGKSQGADTGKQGYLDASMMPDSEDDQDDEVFKPFNHRNNAHDNSSSSSSSDD